MRKLLSIDFWITAFLTTFVTMCFFYIVKKANEKVQIPVINEIIENA